MICGRVISSAKGFEAMGKCPEVGADTLFFHPEPREGHRSADAPQVSGTGGEASFGKIAAHAPYMTGICGRKRRSGF